MDSFIEIFSDSARGVYIPQHFAESVIRDCVKGVDPEDWAILESGPDHADYWETWDSVLNNARLLNNGVEWTLYQDGDLFITHPDYLHEESRDELIQSVDDFIADCADYNETHKDSGDSYSHIPRECWISDHDQRLAAFIAANAIELRGMESDTIAEIALDNFRMESGNIYDSPDESVFVLESFPIQEHEIPLDFESLDLSENKLRQIAGDCHAYIDAGSIRADSALAYLTTDSVWRAVISAKELQAAIDEESTR